jgi:hypothetical protein
MKLSPYFATTFLLPCMTITLTMLFDIKNYVIYWYEGDFIGIAVLFP